MGAASDLVAAGFHGYQGWGDAEAAADFQATGGSGKGSAGGGGVPSFSFDYAGEATKAYGELGGYYDRILKESKGDLTLALSRLVQDYDRGLRIRKEDTASAEKGLDVSQQLAEQRVQQNALARGLYQKSAYDPQARPGGFGIADTMLSQTLEPFSRRRQQLAQGLTRFKESADITRSRQEFDLPEKQRRYEFDLEQRRRKESAELANVRGERAYRDYLNKLQGASLG